MLKTLRGTYLYARRKTESRGFKEKEKGKTEQAARRMRRIEGAPPGGGVTS